MVISNKKIHFEVMCWGQNSALCLQIAIFTENAIYHNSFSSTILGVLQFMKSYSSH